MIPEIVFDTEEFDSIFEEARGRIAGLYPEWTDYNYHDPGITMLELFSWLKEGQQFYMDQTGEEQKEKFLKLLGTKRLRKEPASACILVEPEEDMILPKGTRFYADSICYETTESNYVMKEGITKCFYGNTKVQAFLDKRQLCSGHSLRFPLFGNAPKPGDAFYIGLESALPEQTELSIYFKFFTDYEVKRNPLEKEMPVPFVQYVMEYLTDAGWKEVASKRDETFGFLQDGQFFFQLATSMKEGTVLGEEGYFLRIRILDGCYDSPPLLESISTNMLRVQQIEQLIEHCVIKDYEKQEDGTVTCRGTTFLSMFGETDLYIEEQGTLKELSVVKKYINSKKGFCSFSFQLPKGTETLDRIHMVSSFGEGKRMRVLGNGNEYPDQIYSLSDENGLYEAFSIMAEAEGQYEIWEKVEDFSDSAPEDKHFTFDSREGKVRFGNGYHGLPPDGEIRILSYARCLGVMGKVKDNQIRHISQEFEGDIFITNPVSSWGGQSEETLEQSFLRVRREMEHPITAVSYKDYEAYIKRTPGLMIASCKALLPQEVKEIFPYYDESAITVVVKPYAKEAKKKLLEAYRKNIIAYLEPFRMAGTSVYLIRPEYVQFEVYAEVALKSHYVEGEEKVKETVETFFYNLSREFGCCVHYSRLYGAIDMLSCVRSLHALSLEVKGTGVKHLPDGSVQVPPHAVVELKLADYQFTLE